MNKTHLIVRKEHILCTKCYETEPVHCGDGTPMDTLILAYELMAKRHQTCTPADKLIEEARKAYEDAEEDCDYDRTSMFRSHTPKCKKALAAYNAALDAAKIKR